LKLLNFKGTPQGGVISPVLSNLFLHYVFDKWVTKHYPNTPWCRYADDGLLHCKSKHQAELMLDVLAKRFKDCGLEIHPDKTKIIYCEDKSRKRKYINNSFEFLGYEFRPRRALGRGGVSFKAFTPAVSKSAIKSMIAEIRENNITRRTNSDLADIADVWNPILRGWIVYYGVYRRSELIKVFRYFNAKLVKWVMRKYKKLKNRKNAAYEYMKNIFIKFPTLFSHWKFCEGKRFA